MTSENEKAIEALLEAYNERRFADFGAGYTEDAEIVYPQSGERIVGRNNIQAMVEAFPSPPTFVINRLHTGGDLVVAETDADYGGGAVYHGAFTYKLRDGLVASESACFCAPFEAADWRAPFRES